MAALALRGEHTTWILDDGRSDEVRDLAAELGANYVRRLSGNGAKAGNINHALTLAKGEYFAIFDADFVPKPDFLYETVPFFIDDDVAFVQTPQAYGNMNNLVSRGAGFMQSVFYRFIQPGRNRFNAAFCVGTNVVFRRSAIEDIGGMNTDSKSEDVWTSLELHERGWRSIYIPVTLAVGDAPETVEDYTKQQMRWASGGFEILMQRNPLSPRTRLSLDQRLQYTVTATHYFAGITPFLLLMVPPLEIFFDLHPVDLTVTPLTWFLFYAGFYGLQMLLAFHTMGSFRIETLVLATVSFPIYIAALLNVFSGREQKWHVTGGSGASVLAVQLHDPAGHGLHVPAADLFRRDQQRHRAPEPHARDRLERDEHDRHRRVHRRGVPRVAPREGRGPPRAQAPGRTAYRAAPQAPIGRTAPPADDDRTTSPALEPQLAFATRRALRSTDLRTDRSRPAPASELTTLNDLSEGRIA